jgi:hypothetical protein
VVVVGIDGSSESVHHAEGTDTAVHVVGLASTRPVRRRDADAGLRVRGGARTWRLTDALPRLAHDEPGAPVRAFTEQGDPAAVLVEHARRAEIWYWHRNLRPPRFPRPGQAGAGWITEARDREISYGVRQFVASGGGNCGHPGVRPAHSRGHGARP